MISPAPIYPSGTRPVAVGAGGQFATGLRLTSWDEDAGFAAREDDAERNRYIARAGRWHSISAGPDWSRGYRDEGWGLLITFQ